ncbi:MAG: hypothetical protein ABIL62_07620 [Planctomycetota bacterium]
MKKFLLRHFPFNMLSYTAEPHFQKSVKPVLKSQSFRALLEVLSSQNGHYNKNMASQESNCSSKERWLKRQAQTNQRTTDQT